MLATVEMKPEKQALLLLQIRQTISLSLVGEIWNRGGGGKLVRLRCTFQLALPVVLVPATKERSLSHRLCYVTVALDQEQEEKRQKEGM